MKAGRQEGQRVESALRIRLSSSRSEKADALIVLRLAADARGRIHGDLLVIESDPEDERKTGLPAVCGGHRPISVDRLGSEANGQSPVL